MNISLPGKEPSIDDVSSIGDLLEETQRHIERNPCEIQQVLDSIYASIFYFELDTLPRYVDGLYHCSGMILCRLSLGKHARQSLYQWLIDSSAYFLINGRPVICASSVPEGIPPFKCRIHFSIQTLEDSLGISIRGVTKSPKLISGFPRSVLSLVQCQMLYAPFGRIDHSTEKNLPNLPSKRKYSGVGDHLHESAAVKYSTKSDA